MKIEITAQHVALLATIFLSGLSSETNATIRPVPATYGTIQAGIDSASVGDTVLVAPGRYFENVVIAGKAITLASNYLISHDPSEILLTIIDGSTPTFADTTSCVRVYVANGTVVEGFVMTGGKGTDLFDISDSRFYREGGGMIVDQSTVEIRNNVFAYNLAVEVGPGVTSAGGGGIRVGFTDSALIIGNLFIGNQGLYGAGAVTFHANVDFRNNIMWQNLGGQSFGGGGLWIVGNDLPGGKSRVDNNTIVRNNGSSSGGGIQIGNNSIFLRSNIIRENTATTNPQVTLVGGTTTIYNDIEGAFAGTGNINLAPLYEAGGFLLQSGSPCLDAGDTATIREDIEDLLNPGFAKYPSLGTRRNDIGAYGGPDAIMWPEFSRAMLHADTAFDFGYVPMAAADTSYLFVSKTLLVRVTIDSTKFRGPSAATHKQLTTLPRDLKVTTTDSLRITWKPFFAGTLTDTLLIFHSDTSVANPIRVTLRGTTISPGCCTGSTGNVDCSVSDAADIGDLTALVDNLFISFTPLCCAQEANVDGNPGVDIGDLTTLVDNLFISFAPLPSCS